MVTDRMVVWTIALNKGDTRVEARKRTAKGEALTDAVNWSYATRP